MKLMERNEAELIPFYISKLNPNIQVYFYSKYLEKIVDTNERKMSLVYAEHNGLDVLSITKQVVENIRNLPCEVEGSLDFQVSVPKIVKPGFCNLGATSKIGSFLPSLVIYKKNVVVFAKFGATMTRFG